MLTLDLKKCFVLNFIQKLLLFLIIKLKQKLLFVISIFENNKLKKYYTTRKDFLRALNYNTDRKPKR